MGLKLWLQRSSVGLIRCIGFRIQRLLKRLHHRFFIRIFARR